jgi:hypothetical protein
MKGGQKAGKNLVASRHGLCYFIGMALVIVLWVCLSVVGCLALLRAASRRLDTAPEPAAPEPQVFTANSESQAEPAFVRETAGESALSSSSAR